MNREKLFLILWGSMSLVFLCAIIWPTWPVCTLASLGAGLSILLYQFHQHKMWPLAAGLGISVIGDWGMRHSDLGNSYFILGIMFFGVAHLLYIIYFQSMKKEASWVILIFVLLMSGYGYWFKVALWLGIESSRLKLAVFAYIVVSALSMASSMSVDYPFFIKGLLILGVGNLVFSDTIIAYRSFIAATPLEQWIMPCYLLSHYLMMTSCLSLEENQLVQ